MAGRVRTSPLIRNAECAPLNIQASKLNINLREIFLTNYLCFAAQIINTRIQKALFSYDPEQFIYKHKMYHKNFESLITNLQLRRMRCSFDLYNSYQYIYGLRKVWRQTFKIGHIQLQQTCVSYIKIVIKMKYSNTKYCLYISKTSLEILRVILIELLIVCTFLILTSNQIRRHLLT